MTDLHSSELAVISPIVAPVVKNALNSFAKIVMSQAGRIARATLDRAAVDLRVGFQEYLSLSYERCKYFKTILNPNQPLEIMANYVHINLSCNNEQISDIKLVQDLYNRRHVVVSGLAGSGKSMFMKYLTICKFENPIDGAPLFVELRKLNGLSKIDLIAFIRTSCTAPSSNVTPEQFELSLKAAALILILDGFDEVDHESRDTVQKQILSLSERFPKTTIVISSRPDDRFGGWQSFFVFNVTNLTKKQTLSLIGGLDYDSGVKKRFAKEVNTKLYKSHTSFLSSPLLTTIMLLTYEEFAEIPDKMHMFYGQAFDTLYQKHDAQKEQYQRKTHAGLTREDFKSCFSAFCAMSYLEQKFSFDEKSLLQSAQSAVDYTRQTSQVFSKVSARQLIDDLKESVCMIQADGLETIFVHRSFQEYFAALFATNVNSGITKKIIDKYSYRFADSVIAMALDMGRDTIEQQWVLPAITELRETLDLDNLNANNGIRFAKMFSQVTFGRVGNSIWPGSYELNIQVLGPFEALRRMYPNYLGTRMSITVMQPMTIARGQKIWLGDENKDRANYATLQNLLQPIEPTGKRSRLSCKIKISAEDEWWLNAAGAAKMFKAAREGFAKIEADINERAGKRADILELFI